MNARKCASSTNQALEWSQSGPGAADSKETNQQQPGSSLGGRLSDEDGTLPEEGRQEPQQVEEGRRASGRLLKQPRKDYGEQTSFLCEALTPRMCRESIPEDVWTNLSKYPRIMTREEEERQLEHLQREHFFSLAGFKKRRSSRS
jgi:hypothetical protein